MEIRALKPHLNVIALLLLASLALGFTVDVHLEDVAGVKVDLPERVAGWRGVEILFCQNNACQRSWTLDALEGRTQCPQCGGALDPMAAVEKALLPPDTRLIKKQYKNEAGRTIYASVVLSGKERASIHRPEVCLVGQGSEIVKRFVLPVDLGEGAVLETMMINLTHRRHEAGGRITESATYYDYWFVGNGRETARHWQRMLWMATDRIFHNRAHRWAYIAVSGQRDPGNNQYEEEAREFIRDLYPQMAIRHSAGT